MTHPVATFVPVVIGDTRGKSRLHYLCDHTHNTDLEITITADGEGWSGGLSASASQKDERQYKYTFVNWTRKALKLEWEFVQWVHYCFAPGNYGYFASGMEKWKPNKISSGSKTPDVTNRFTCQDKYISPFAATTTVAREARVRFQGWFTVAEAFRADLLQENGSKVTMTIDPDSGVSANICGSNANPLDANRVREVS